MRSYYYRVLEIAIQIIGNGGVALQEKGSDLLLRSFIINFDNLFESYIRRVLQSAATKDVSVLDGNSEGKQPLFHDKKDPPAQPDIVLVAASTGRKLVADVKYKDSVKRDDINQAVTYAVSYGCPKTVIIHQVRPGAEPGLKHIGSIGNITVLSYAFNLDNNCLSSEEGRFANAMFALVR